MENVIRLTDYSCPELDVYARLTGAQQRNRLEPEKGILIAESPSVIEVALDAGCRPLSLLTEERLINGAVSGIIERIKKISREENREIPIYTAENELLKKITGFELTRGALCAMYRPKETTPEELCRTARRIAVLEEIADSTNIGALFRSAAALGIDAVMITPTCCDPLCRRAVRVSMGTVFQVPWCRIGESPEEWEKRGIDILHSLGFKTAAMALTDNSVGIRNESLRKEERLAILLGTEGTGLKKSTIATSDYTVKIPMSHGVDSLNVGAAGAIAFWELTQTQ